MNAGTNEFEAVIAAAGWYPGRNMTGLVSSWRNRILLRGGSWMPKAEAVLAEYRGLGANISDKRNDRLPQ